MNRTILTVAGVLSASSLLLVDSAIKGTVLLVLAAVVALFLRRDSAATRHLVWLLAIVAMLVVPVLSAMLPQWRVLPAWASHSPRPDVVDVSPPAIAAPGSGVIELPQMAEPVEVERPIAIVDQRVAALPDSPPILVTPDAVPAPAVRSWNWLHALPLVWVIGFAVLLLRLSAARWMLWNSERRGTVIRMRVAPQLAFESRSDSATARFGPATPTTHDPIVTAMEAICLQLGISRPVTLLIHPDKTIPVVWGILRSRLLLPAAARGWSEEQLRSVLLHELAHVKRCDATVQLLTQIACALHWFNPLVWFAAWRLDVERERACDDLVLASGVRPSAYAGHLLEVVTGLSPARWTQSCGLAMARKSSLEGRLVAVLGKNLNRRGVSVALAGIALAIAAGIAVPIAMLGAADEKPAVSVQRQESQPEAQAKDESPKAKVVAKLPGRIFVNAGLRTTKDDKRFSQSAIAIDPNTGSWTRLQDLSKGGFTVPLSPVRVSPDGKTMLFMREKEIWKCDALTGENPVRVFQKGQPKAWAPDSKEFLVVVDQEAGSPDKTENWRVSADGKQQSQLSLPIGDVVEDWSPDGRWLLGWSHADGQLHIMKPDGSDRRKLTNSNRNASRNEHPRFSPDGRRIAYLQTLYQGTDDAPDSRFSLRTINIDGTDDREILGETAVAPAPAKATWTAPMGARWSPDGKHLAIVLFDHTRDGGILAINGNWRLAIIDADGGNLRELKLEGVLTAVLLGDGPEWRPLPPAVATQEPKPGAQLKPATEQKLKWGEPVSGLRMALAWPPTLGEPGMGDAEEFFLVVQNVSETAVRLAAGDDAPNPRRLMMRENGRPLQAISDPVPTPGDWLLQPREVAFLRLYQSNANWKDGRTVSSAIEQDIRTVPRYSMTAEMTIAKAPAGAWKGKLVTGQTRGSADVAAAPTPMHKDARALYEVWQRYARANGDIPGALVGELAAAVKTFIKYNPTWETVPKLNAILPRLDATHDWKPADVIALLDEVAGIQDSPLKAAVEKATRSSIRNGEALPKKFAKVRWGHNLPGGTAQIQVLHAAWVLEPDAVEHRIGEALKARLLVKNPRRFPVVVQVPTFHQGAVRVHDAKHAEVEVAGISWTTLAQLVPVRLGPGEYIEISTPGVGLGPRAGMGPWAGPRVGSNVLAKPGDELTLTLGLVPPAQQLQGPESILLGNERTLVLGLVPLDGSEVGVSEDDPHVSGPGWWKAHIKARLNRELPLPADAAERTRLLDRAVRELFAIAPTAEETAEFIADKTPDALDALAKRLAARDDALEFSGTLQTAPVKFRVIAADPDADKQPRVVLGPGEYPLPSASAERGDATLKIVGKPVGDRHTNDAQLIFEATEFTGARPPDPHKLEVPDGWGTWAIVCRPDSGVLYLLSKGAVRKIDYTKPRNVTDTPANDLPAEFRDEVKRQLEIAGVSAEQQAVVFEKPAPPAATPEAEKPKGAAVKLTLDALLGFWRGTMDGKDLMLSFHRPPVEKDVQVHIYFGRATIGRLARFNIAPDGDSALVVLEGGDNAVLGTLRPIDANTMRLVGADKEGKAAAFAMLTRDVEPPATEPRQKEARELFEMWKRTANEDGTIPGTFIGQLATEVRAHVMANPNSDSGMKLPKLLPRFVTSRDWTQAEAIKLLDDLAYYSTQPIVARVAKAKLPSGPLWRTEVEFADIPVKISKWSEAKDGLRVGMRVVDADWRIGLGGGARVELWLHNADNKDVTFKTTGPDRQDTGVAVGAIDAEGREHWADGVNVLIYAGPMDCKLPAGHVALAKKFEVTFAEPGSHEKTWLTPRFHGLKHGKYQLRSKWMDAYPDISKPGEWKGELTAPDHAFTLAAAVSAADLEAKPAPKLAKLPVAAAVAAPQVAETPKTTEQEAFTAWGKEISGLQAGLGFKAGEKRAYTFGETVTLVVRVRNVGNKDVKFKYYPTFLSENSPTVLDETGKRVSLRGNTLRLVQHDVPKEVNLAVGKEIELYERELRLASGNEDAGELKTRDIFPTGKFLIQHEQVIGNSAQASDKLDPTLEKLATGKLEFEVREAFTAWGKEVGGLQAGFGFKVGEKRAYTHGDWATLVVRVRNVGKDEVKFQYLRQFFVEQPPTVFKEKGELKQLGRTIALGVHSPVEVKLAAGKEIELYELKVYLGTGSEEGIPKYPYIFGTGKFQVQYEKVFGNSSSGSIKLDPALSKLATGKLELEIKPVASPPAAEAPNAKLQPATKLHNEHADIALEKDGTLFLNKKKVTLNELKVQAPKDPRKSITIRADKDVPYAKVIEVVDALRAAGVTEFSFSVVAFDAPAPKPRIEHADVDLEKDGTLFLNGNKVTLDELKALAAKDAKKRFTIRADKDVPYSKVIEVLDALKAAGVTEFSFRVVAPDAPAPTPRIEHADVNLEKDGTLFLNRKKVTLDEKVDDQRFELPKP